MKLARDLYLMNISAMKAFDCRVAIGACSVPDWQYKHFFLSLKVSPKDVSRCAARIIFGYRYIVSCHNMSEIRDE